MFYTKRKAGGHFIEQTTTRGIDVSTHNGTIDWRAAFASGIRFAIVRAGYGRYRHQEDRQLKNNLLGAAAAGMQVGAYWFLYAHSAKEARQEAAMCKAVLAPYKALLSYPVYADFEYDSERNVALSREERTKIIVAFCEELARDYPLVGVYTNLDYARNKLVMPLLAPYELWLADYSGGPSIACGVQQTSSAGTVAGVKGNVDTNLSFANYPKQPHAYVSSATGTVVLEPESVYSFTVTGKNIPLVAGTDGVVRLFRCREDEGAALWHAVPIGVAGKATGIYHEGHECVFVAQLGGAHGQ